MIGRTPLLAARHEVIIAAIDRAQAVRQKRAVDQLCQGRAARMSLGNFDLIQDELKVVFDEIDHLFVIHPQYLTTDYLRTFVTAKRQQSVCELLERQQARVRKLRLAKISGNCY